MIPLLLVGKLRHIAVTCLKIPLVALEHMLE